MKTRNYTTSDSVTGIRYSVHGRSDKTFAMKSISLFSRWKKVAFGALFFLSHCFLSTIQAQVAEWTFENISSAVPSTPIAASSKIPQVSATARLSGGKNNGSPDVCSGSETWSTNFWPTGSSRSTGDYIEFMVRADPGEFIDITRFAFTSSASSGNSALQFDVYYSENNFTTSRFLFSGTHSTGGCSSKSGSLSTTVFGNGHIKFRIYPYGQNIAAQAATIRLDNVRISGNVLPVTLSSFEAVPQEGQVLLEWTTATEINNDYFAIERSASGLTFAEIGRMPGKGNSQSEVHYQFVDREAPLGIIYYRLRQVDFDGTINYHPVVAVNLEEAFVGDRIKLFPTIAHSTIQVELGFEVDHQLPFAIYSMQGRLLQKGLLDTHNTGINLQISDLPAGAYVFRLVAQGKPYAVRFMKQ